MDNIRLEYGHRAKVQYECALSVARMANIFRKKKYSDNDPSANWQWIICRDTYNAWE